MKIYSPKNKLLFFLFLIISLTISCSTKLPSDKSLVEDFTKNADEYEKLVKIFKENGFVEINESSLLTFFVKDGNYSFIRCDNNLKPELIPKPSETPNPRSKTFYEEIISQTLKVTKPANTPCPTKETWDYLQSKLKELNIKSIYFYRNQTINFSKLYLKQEASDGVMMNIYNISFIFQPESPTKLIDSVDVISNHPEAINFYRKINDDWYILVDKRYDFAVKPE